MDAPDVSHVLTMARISVLEDAATLGLLFHPAERARVNALIDAGIVVARRPVPDVAPGERGRWGRLSLTSKGVVLLRCETARISGRKLSLRKRQLPLFPELAP